MFKSRLSSSPINSRLLVWRWLQTLSICILTEVAVLLFIGIFGLIVRRSLVLKQSAVGSTLVLIPSEGGLRSLPEEF